MALFVILFLLLIVVSLIWLARRPMIVTIWGLRLNGANKECVRLFREKFGRIATMKSMMRWLKGRGTHKTPAITWQAELMAGGRLDFVHSMLKFHPDKLAKREARRSVDRSITNRYYRTPLWKRVLFPLKDISLRERKRLLA